MTRSNRILRLLLEWAAVVGVFVLLTILALASATMADTADANSGNQANLQAYVDVTVTDDLSDPDNPSTSLTTTFHPIAACTADSYNAISDETQDNLGLAAHILHGYGSDSPRLPGRRSASEFRIRHLINQDTVSRQPNTNRACSEKVQ